MSNRTTITSRLVIMTPFLLEFRTETLVAACRRFAALKDFNSLKGTASLIDAPIGRYYEALARNQRGADPDAFDIDALYDKYKPRALLSIAQSFRHRGDLTYALRLSVESHNLAITHQDWYTAGNAQREIAIAQSSIGDHRRALGILEAAMPDVRNLRTSRVVFAALFGDYHNSLAVELCEMGRLDEATRALGVALGSPFVGAYPEWRETSNEIALKGRSPSRSTVAITRRVNEPRSKDSQASVAGSDRAETQGTQKAGNIVTLPTERFDSQTPVETETLARYVSRIIKEKDITPHEVEQMSGGRITDGYVRGIITGKAKNPSVDKLKALGLGLGVSEDEIFKVARGLLPECGSLLQDPQSNYHVIVNLMSASLKNRTLTDLLSEVARLPRESQEEAVRMLRYLNARKHR